MSFDSNGYHSVGAPGQLGASTITTIPSFRKDFGYLVKPCGDGP